MDRILRLGLVHVIDGRFHQFVSRGAAGALGEQSVTYAVPSEDRLESDSVFALAGKAVGIPNLDFLEGDSVYEASSSNLRELRSVGDLA